MILTGNFNLSDSYFKRVRVKRGNEKRIRKSGKRVKAGKAEKRVKGGKAEKRVKGGKRKEG